MCSVIFVSTLFFLILSCTLHACCNLTVAGELSANAVCPTNCSCAQPSPDQLEISCSDRRDDVTFLSSLQQEIDALLRATANKPLRSLTIKSTALGQVPDEVCKLEFLEKLDLSGNRLTALPDDCICRLGALREFWASENRITTLQDGLFNGLVHLELLMLDHNEIDTIGFRVLSNRIDLPRLKTIDLKYNQLTSLEPWPMIRAQASPGLTVYVTNNQISRFTNAANWTYNCSQPILYLYYWVGYNRIRHISDFMDVYFTSTSEIICFLRGRYEFRLQINPLICDCLDFNFFAFLDAFPDTKYLAEYSTCDDLIVSGFSSRNMISVPLEELVCDIKEQCPAGCTCVNQPYNLTFHVLCSSVGLNELPHVVPPANVAHTVLMPNKMPSYKLDFSGNKLQILEARFYFNHAAVLDVSNAQLENIIEEALASLQNVERIYLHDNLLTTLPRSVTTMNFTFRYLSLYNNPLDCSCDQVWSKDWLEAVRDFLENADAMHCNTPAKLHGRIIWTLNETDFCFVPSLDPPDMTIVAYAIAAVSMVCVAAVSTGILLMLRFRSSRTRGFVFIRLIATSARARR